MSQKGGKLFGTFAKQYSLAKDLAGKAGLIETLPLRDKRVIPFLLNVFEKFVTAKD